MLDMGFLPDLKKIMAQLPKNRQSLFFSATLPKRSRELANELLFNPVSVNVTPETPSVDRIDQKVLLLEKAKKMVQLEEILSQKSTKRTIVFTRTKRGANVVAKKLNAMGIRSEAIHGNKSQNARQRALEAFRSKKISVLVATDVAARGIDIDGVTHVVNYDMPFGPIQFVSAPKKGSSRGNSRGRRHSGRRGYGKSRSASAKGGSGGGKGKPSKGKSRRRKPQMSR